LGAHSFHAFVARASTKRLLALSHGLLMWKPNTNLSNCHDDSQLKIA
jgi:hypothetical protein